jgi:hypothetical protein
MRRIEIDEEVYAVLEANARGFIEPNGVLRVLLGIDDKKSVPNSTPLAPRDYISGKLRTQIDDGVIEPGDTLVHHQPRLGNTYRATVTADGWISTEKRRYQSPSAALSDLVGTQISGWGNWVHERSGKTLRELRDSAHPHD